jgi:hypothetical protein
MDSSDLSKRLIIKKTTVNLGFPGRAGKVPIDSEYFCRTKKYKKNMKKHLFNFGLCLLAATFGFAQSKQVALAPSPTQAHVMKTVQGSASNLQARPSATLASCARINDPLPVGWTPSLYTYGGVANGYFNGVNIDGDIEKAMFFNTSAVSFTTLNQVDVDFGAANTSNPAKVVGLKIYSVTGGIPGTLLGTSAVTMSDIMSDLAGGFTTSFYFPAGVTLPANKQFFVSLDISGLSHAAGDVLGMVSNADGESPNTVWERWASNGSWNSYTTSYSPTVYNMSLFMFPHLSNGPVVSNFSASANPICTGSTITYNYGGSAVTGGFFWSASTSATTSYTTNTVTSPVVTYPTAGTFTTTLTNANACGAINASQITVTVNPRPGVTATPASTTVCNGTSIVFNGGGANTYTWTGGISNGVGFTPSSSQNYTVTGTAANGCTNSAVSSVVVSASGPAVTATATASSICLGQSVTLTGGGASTYVWTGGISNGVAFTPTSTQTYTVTGSVGSCTNTAVVTINVNPVPTVNANASAANVCAGGQVTLTGSGTASSYAWTGSVTNGVAFAPSSTQTYTVTGTLGSCTKTAAVTVTVGAALNVTANTTAATICQGQNVALTGGGASSYVWTGGINNGVAFVPTSTQTYTVTGTTGSCTNTAVVTVAVNTAPSVSSNPTSATICSGSTVTFSGNGASSYVWSGGISNGLSFSPTTSGSYTVTGTAANGCTATAVANVTVNATPNVTANTTTTAICPGSLVTLTGGGAASYLWTDGVVNGNPFAPSITKTYTVTGANGICTNTAAITVFVNASPNVTANPPAATSCNGSNITLAGGGATSYVWTGGIANGVAFSPTSSGTYTVTGTAANGCTATAISSITVVSSLNVTAGSSSNAVCQGSSVTLNGGGATSYAWSGSVADGTPFTPSSTQTYTVTGTAGSCSNTAVITVTVNALPSVTANATSTNVCTGSNVTLNGGGASSYAWSNGVINNIPFAPTTSTVYVVTGTTGACSNTASVTVVVTPVPVVSAVASSTSICLGSNVTLTGFGATTYAWTNGVTNNIPFTPVSTSIYVVSGNSNGCVGTSTIQVVVNTCTGIEEASSGSDATVIVYPNPNAGEFTIKGNKEAIVIISNELGQVIQTVALTYGDNFSCQINGLAQGMYFLSGSAVKQKVVVTK